VSYDVAPDARSFVMVQEPEELPSERQQIVYVPNFSSEPTARVAR